MKYILIGTLLGSIVTSSHDSEEACKGRREVLKEKGAVVECYKDPSTNLYGNITGCTITNCVLITPGAR